MAKPIRPMTSNATVNAVRARRRRGVGTQSGFTSTAQRLRNARESRPPKPATMKPAKSDCGCGCSGGCGG